MSEQDSSELAPLREEVTNSSTNDMSKSGDEEKQREDAEKQTEQASETQLAGEDKNKEEYDSTNVHYEGDVAVHTDPNSGFQYEWDKEKNEWVSRTNYGFEDDTHTYTDNDGVKYFWDKEKKAWFPKIDDDFMAQYQMSYGFVDNTSKPEEKPKEKTEEVTVNVPKVEKGVKRKPSEPTWFELDSQRNTKVYVSNLPLDINEEEFAELMQKCGIIMRDPTSGNLKIKLYSDGSSQELKGDGLCTYIRVESVDLAIKLLDGYDVRGKKIKVERAKFQMKGEYDPKLKPKSKKRKEKDKLRKMQEKLFDWRPEKKLGERSKHERVVIVKNVFEPKMFDEDVGLILELQEDIRTECGKCGEVRKVIIYDRHPEGVVQINMKEPEEADACVTLLHGRWFGKRKLTAEIWDGRTKFKIAETDSEISKRIDNWEQFLEGDDDKKIEQPT